jgi:hypothetical protein
MKKRSIFLAIGILLFAPGARADGGDGQLLRVDAEGLPLNELIAEMDVLKDLGSSVLALADGPDRERLAARGFAYEVLDADPAGKEFYAVYARGGVDLSGIDAAGDILYLGEDLAVVRTAPGSAERVAGLGFEIARVFMEPMKPVQEFQLSSKGILSVHPAIDDMVAAVDTGTLHAVVNDLAAAGGYNTRKSNTAGGLWAAQYIHDQFVSYGIADVSFHNFDANADNVVAVIPGTAFPENIIVLGGHYDSIATLSSSAPGADDNASGAVAVLEAARILSRYAFENTIVFIAFASEEFGLFGSNAYARDAYNRGDNILAMLNVDMIGYLAAGDVQDVDIIAGSSSYGLRDLAFWATEQYVPGFPAIPGAGVIGGSSDQASFTDYGYPAIWFFEDVANDSPYIHTANDTVGQSLNSFEFMTRCTQSIVATLASLAEPVDDIAIGHTPLAGTSDTSNPYTVKAQVVSIEPLASGYPVVRYAINGGTYTDLVMAPTGNPDEYGAAIPAQPLNTTVSYYIEAEDILGSVDTSPAAAPDAVYVFEVAQGSSGWAAAEMASSTIGAGGAGRSAPWNFAALFLVSVAVLLRLKRKGR